MVPVWMILSDIWPRFHGYDIIQVHNVRPIGVASIRQEEAIASSLPPFVSGDIKMNVLHLWSVKEREILWFSSIHSAELTSLYIFFS